MHDESRMIARCRYGEARDSPRDRFRFLSSSAEQPAMPDLDVCIRKLVMCSASEEEDTRYATLCDADPLHPARDHKDQREPCTTRCRQEVRRKGGRKNSRVVLDHGAI